MKYIDINNKVPDQLFPQKRRNIGIHTYPSGDCDSVHSGDVDHHELMPAMFKTNAAYFFIQLATEKNKAKVGKEIGEHICRDVNSIKQVPFIGVVNPLHPRVKTPEEVVDALVRSIIKVDRQRPARCY